ncbi:IclR family transcriptional regulator [Halocalculus aciditolerans]|uniref:IclR family transcriptional regulator n=1 Tax=Halocalculus aciditolerans TaxID=1383812 RepID=A0A830FPF6_9EURY|nr:IclR family transcriptional regulator [Halocalculus aciditolerans]GGL67441.1 IclR family transcriptional regulator [Halocalculus aciditolerans]
MTDRERAGDGGQGGRATIKSLETTFTIVESLQELGGGRLTELATHTGISKSTVHKHLATLVEQGYVVKEGDDYRLGFKFLDVGGHARAEFLGTDIIKPKMQELAEKTSETAQFMTEERGRAVVLYREAGRKSVPSRTRTGKHMYLHQTASGKAILSGLPDERVHEILDERGLPRATESTITDREALLEELAEIRETGISYSYGESTKGLYAVAAPMYSPDDTVLGACAVSGPSHRMRGEPMSEELPSIILSIVNEIELNIAHA